MCQGSYMCLKRQKSIKMFACEDELKTLGSSYIDMFKMTCVFLNALNLSELKQYFWTSLAETNMTL